MAPGRGKARGAEAGENPTLVETPLDHPMFRGFFGAWLWRGTPSFLVDAGPAGAAGHLVSSLKGLGLERLDYVLLSHIHLDHAGGVSRVLEEYPEARVICHRRAVPHLMDPGRLWAGSLRVLGETAELYGSVEPVPEERLVPHDRVRLQGLSVVGTRGHAPHHVSFLLHGHLFAGEAAGNYLLAPGGAEWLRPATPPRFILEESMGSVELLMELGDMPICYAHFGRSESSREMLLRFKDQLLRWRDILGRILGRDPEADPDYCIERLLAEDPELAGFRDLDREARQRERFFMRNSVRGYLGYLRESG